LDKPTHVSLTIYNSYGKELSVLVDCRQADGLHNLVFKAENINAGVYYFVLKTDSNIITKKILIVK